MAELRKITEGLTGFEAADIIYGNDESINTDVAQLDTRKADIYNENNDKVVYAPGGIIDTTIEQGSFTKAHILSLKDVNKVFQYILNDTIDGVHIQKSIWHIGNSVFVDAVGAVVELPVNEDEIYNFKFTIKLLTDNQAYILPTLSNTYNMRINWGDGSDVESFAGVGGSGKVTHAYSGVTGTEFQISIAGSAVPQLPFSTAIYTNPLNIVSVDNNTLRGLTKINFSGCSNLFSVCANLLQNYNGSSSSSTVTTENLAALFMGCTSLKNIEAGFNKYLAGKSKYASMFFNCGVEALDDDFFIYSDNISIATSMFQESQLRSIPSSLAPKLVSVPSFYFMFNKMKNGCNIPSDIFSYNTETITDVRQCFSGTSAANLSPLTGNAEAIYNAIIANNPAITNYSGCFANNNMSNKTNVPAGWK